MTYVHDDVTCVYDDVTYVYDDVTYVYDDVTRTANHILCSLLCPHTPHLLCVLI